MDLNARVDVNCKRTDALTGVLTDRRTEDQTSISHPAKAGATINERGVFYKPNNCICKQDKMERLLQSNIVPYNDL